MANKIKLKRSSVANKVPLATDLDVGEVAVNTADAKLYTKHSDGVVKAITGASTNLLEPHLPFTVGSGNDPWWGSNNPSESFREVHDTPFSRGVVWVARNKSTENGADGGWNSSRFPINSSKRYRYSVYAMQSSHNGTLYWGTHGYGGSQGTLNNLNGSSNGNPYAFSADLPTTNTWYLIVGYVFEHSYTGGTHTDHGVYDLTTGLKVSSGGSDYKWHPENNESNTRAYQYYNATPTEDEYHFWQPRFEEVNGEEPSISELCGYQKGGPGSGLDADLLDGQHASAFAASSHTHSSVAQSDYVSGSGFSTTAAPDNVLEYAQASGVTDTKVAPSSDWYNSIRLGHGDPYTYYSNTIAVKMTGSGQGALYTQTINNGTALGWNKHWHNNNDGSGSGLDADLLDGNHASAFATSGHTHNTATSSTAGLVKIGYTESGKNYPVELSSGKAYVNVPWTDTDTNTTYSTATSTTSGLIKIGYTESGKNYPVELSGGKAYVNVPWSNTDTNTTYSDFTTTVSGLVPAPTANNTAKFLRGDGMWDTPTNTNTTYSADGNYGMTLSGTTFRLENDRRRNSSSADVWSGNTHDYTWYDASVGIRWYTAGAEEMRLTNAGDLHVDGNITAYSTTVSDKNLKTDIKKIDNALDKVNQLNGCTFTYTSDGKESAGLIAQEVEEVLPSAVTTSQLVFHGEEGKEYKVLQYDQTIGLLVEAIKELSAKVDALEK